MTDFDDQLRAAVATAAARAVPPPFAAVERRAHARKTRAVVLAAASVVAIAAAAVALPRVAARDTTPAKDGLRPWPGYTQDRVAVAAYTACRDERSTPTATGRYALTDADIAGCLNVAGYAPPDEKSMGMSGDWLRLMDCNVADEPRYGVVVARGTVGGRGWHRSVYPGNGALTCEATRLDGVPALSSDGHASGPVVSVSALYDLGPHGSFPLGWDVVAGVAPENAVKVRVNTGGKSVDVRTVRAPFAPGLSFYAIAVRHRTAESPVSAVAFDARGRIVDRRESRLADGPRPPATGDPSASPVYLTPDATP